MSNSKSLSQKRYTRYADGYVTSQTHATGSDLARLVDMAQAQSDWRVLDIATGGGHTALTFAPLVRQVIATDLTWRMLYKARAHIEGQGVSNAIFCPADAENLPFANDRFGLVTCRIAPHHFPDCARFVAEAARVTRPGGRVLVQDHVLPSDESAGTYIDDFERLRDPSHNRAFSQDQWVAMFEQAGLTVSEVDEASKKHDLVDWATRQGADQALITELRTLLVDAPDIVTGWLAPSGLDGESPTFLNRHILILGLKETTI